MPMFRFPARRRAFTAIELMIAMALSLLIILLATAAVRMTARSITLVSRLSNENQLLLSGFLASMDDADFWRSQADPAFPWAKQAQSLANVDINGNPVAAGDAKADTNANKRLFRPVTFDAGQPDRDPNWSGPHDPRSWYRNHLAQNPRPIPSNGTGYAASNSRKPPGYSPRAVFGDYAAVANLGMAATSIGGARPALMMRLFQQLGFTGVQEYMPRGTISIMLRPDRSAATGAMPATQADNYDQGEIPWTLAGLNTDDSSNMGFGKDTYDPFQNALGGDSTYASAIPDRGRSNYAEALYGRYVQRSLGRIEKYENCTLAFKDWAMDLDWATWYDALVFGTRHQAKTGGGWSIDYINQPTRRPMRSATRWSGDGKDNMDLGSLYTALWDDYGNTTMLVPATLSNERPEDLALLPKDMPTLSLSSFRHIHRCAGLYSVRIQVNNPSTGQMLQLDYSIAGTSYRGARQHWGALRAVRDAGGRVTAAPDMGDYYAP